MGRVQAIVEHVGDALASALESLAESVAQVAQLVADSNVDNFNPVAALPVEAFLQTKNWVQQTIDELEQRSQVAVWSYQLRAILSGGVAGAQSDVLIDGAGDVAGQIEGSLSGDPHHVDQIGQIVVGVLGAVLNLGRILDAGEVERFRLVQSGPLEHTEHGVHNTINAPAADRLAGRVLVTVQVDLHRDRVVAFEFRAADGAHQLGDVGQLFVIIVGLVEEEANLVDEKFHIARSLLLERSQAALATRITAQCYTNIIV